MNPEATLEEKVEFLLLRDQDVQRHLEETAKRLLTLPERWKARIEVTAVLLRTELAQSLQDLPDRHPSVRLIGIALAVRIMLATWGSLIEGLVIRRFDPR